jgi:hypothetical protein
MHTQAMILWLRRPTLNGRESEMFMCGLTLEVNGTQQMSRSGILKLFVRVGRNVRHSFQFGPKALGRLDQFDHRKPPPIALLRRPIYPRIPGCTAHEFFDQEDEPI